MKIVIPGGSGQVGRILSRYFFAQGHEIIVLSRFPGPAPWNTIHWDGRNPGEWVRSLEGSDVCINLTGRSVNCRYTPANRKLIYETRIRSTQLLNQVIAGLEHPPRVWLNASTATIYRHSFDRAMAEDGELGGSEAGAPDAWNFSIAVAKDWEAAFFEKYLSSPTLRTRKIAMRSAITMSPDRGGAFDILLSLVRRGLGGPQGSGEQFVSWIHETDFARAVEFLIEHEEIDGVVNIAAPSPLRNHEFMRALRHAWGTPAGLPAPSWLIEIASFFMRTESELVLKSRRVVPGRLADAGFIFHYSEWPEAAEELVSRSGLSSA